MSARRERAIARSVEAFLAHAAVERNLSPRTVEAYKETIDEMRKELAAAKK